MPEKSRTVHDIDTINWVDQEIYRAVVENVPVHCVDIVVDCGSGILLGLRTNEPFKDQWWFPGGRQWKGEGMEQTAYRIAEEELGVEVDVQQQVGTYDLMYPTSEFGEDISKHTPATVYVVEPQRNEFEPDEQHSALKVFEELPDDPHPYVFEVYTDAVECGYINLE